MAREELRELLSQGFGRLLEHETGQLPLHIALATKQYSHDVLVDILEAYPDAASIKDKVWRLPLHCALEGTPAPTEFILRLIETYPDAAMMADTRMYLPLHVAMESTPSAPIEVVQGLLTTYPQAASQFTLQRVLPMHLALGARPSHHFTTGDMFVVAEITASSDELEALIAAQPLALCFGIGKRCLHTDPDDWMQRAFKEHNFLPYLKRFHENGRPESLHGEEHTKDESVDVEPNVWTEGTHPLTLALCTGVSMDTWMLLLRNLAMSTHQGPRDFSHESLKHLYAQALAFHMTQMQAVSKELRSARQVTATTAVEAILSWLPECHTPEARSNHVIDWGFKRTMLHWMLLLSPRPPVELVKRVLDADVEAVKMLDHYDMLPLNCAVDGDSASEIDILRLLLQHHPLAVTQKGGNHFVRCRVDYDPDEQWCPVLPLQQVLQADAPREDVVMLLYHTHVDIRRHPHQTTAANDKETLRLDTETLLFLALRHPRALKNFVKLLVETHPQYASHRMRLSKRSAEGLLPLHVALRHDPPKDLVEYLLKANPSAAYEVNLLHLALNEPIWADLPEPQLRALFREQGPNCYYCFGYCEDNDSVEDEYDRGWWSVLGKSASLEVIEYLTERYPHDVHTPDHEGNIALHVAVRGRAPPEVVEHLIRTYPEGVRKRNDNENTDRYEECVDSDGEFQTVPVRGTGALPLHVACGLVPADTQVVKTLLNHFSKAVSKPNSDTSGDLPLESALKCHGLSLELFELLFEAYPEAVHCPLDGSSLGNLLRFIEKSCAVCVTDRHVERLWQPERRVLLPEDSVCAHIIQRLIWYEANFYHESSSEGEFRTEVPCDMLKFHDIPWFQILRAMQYLTRSRFCEAGSSGLNYNIRVHACTNRSFSKCMHVYGTYYAYIHGGIHT
jgi:hypothetical protein